MLLAMGFTNPVASVLDAFAWPRTTGATPTPRAGHRARRARDGFAGPNQCQPLGLCPACDNFSLFYSGLPRPGAVKPLACNARPRPLER